MDLRQKKSLRQKRVWRIRKKIKGTQERPRLCVHFSNKHIYAQAIDDVTGHTIVCLTTLNKDLRQPKFSANTETAAKVGKLFGEKAKEKGIENVVFDRNGRRFHGVVKVFADAAREAGLKF